MITAAIREQVRERSHFACEYCGVTETDAGGLLTIDHFLPQSQGGQNTLDNLIYCCSRCNLYKANYFPQKPDDADLWNPRQEEASVHLIQIADGSLYPLTSTGKFTLERLRLNRPQLVTLRLRKRSHNEQANLAARLNTLIEIQESLAQQQADLLLEQHRLLSELRNVIRLLS